jgi:hypothetical protein
MLLTSLAGALPLEATGLLAPAEHSRNEPLQRAAFAGSTSPINKMEKI